MKPIRFLSAILFLLAAIACTQTPQPVAVVPSELPTAQPEAVTAEPTSEPTPEPVLLFNEAIPRDTQKLVLQMPIASFEAVEDALSVLPNVTDAEITFSEPWESDLNGLSAYLRFWHAHPLIRLTEIFPEGDVSCREQTALTLSEPMENLDLLIAAMPSLESLTLPAGTDAQSIAAVASTFPSLKILFSDEQFGLSDASATTLTLMGSPSLESLKAYLACFGNLESVDLRNTTLTEEEGNALSDAFPTVSFARTVTLNGKPYDTTTESLNFDGAKIADYDAFKETLRYFPRVTSLEMNECNLKDEQIAAIREQYPNMGVVWTVHVRGRRVRTDRIAFSTKQYKDNTNRFTTDMVAPLQYCTSLIALDLGHNAVTDLEWIKPLQNLQVLILADNHVTDLTPLASLKKLKYVELFLNKFTDVTPLGELPELLDVNICYTRAEDLTPLCNCPKLERIWISKSRFTQESLSALQQTFPNAIIDYDAEFDSTGRGWRKHPRYDAYLEMFRTDQPVDPFLP